MTAIAIMNLIALAQPQVLRLAVDDLYRGVTAEKLGRYALALFSISLVAGLFKFAIDRKSTRLNSSHSRASRMPSSA